MKFRRCKVNHLHQNIDILYLNSNMGLDLRVEKLQNVNEILIFCIFDKFKWKKRAILTFGYLLRYIAGKKQRTMLRFVTMSKFSFNLQRYFGRYVAPTNTYWRRQKTGCEPHRLRSLIRSDFAKLCVLGVEKRQQRILKFV